MDLYRYMPFESFVDMVVNKKLTLLSPDLWEDTFDGWLWKEMTDPKNTERYPKMNKISDFVYNHIFAQCWTKNCDSIALWNIYSYDKKAIMVHTTYQELEKLSNIIIREITYSDDISVPIDFLVNFATLKHDMKKMIEPLTVKRSGFSYENEVRIFANNSAYIKDNKSLDINIPSIRDFIKGVTAHPLAEEWYIDIVKSFCDRFDVPFNGKSNLYNLDLWEGDVE